MFEEKEFHGLKYLVRYPAGHKAGDKHPTILFLHGAGTRGDDLGMIRANSFFRITGEYEDFPFVCVAPQCRCVDTWYDYWETLKAFVKDILASDYCDEHRFYVIGNSMGGYATWQMGISMPEVIAAIAPICGGGVAWNTGRLKDVPVWAFHGAKDPAVNIAESIRMVDGVNKRGGNAKLTVYPDVQHDCWLNAYADPALFEWFLSHTK
ncbi:MAG: alpha/beta fold hydrolase [Clostridia bacterium]|nr:alpha/beta fold hydrolase [Clostridia bacterium]